MSISMPISMSKFTLAATILFASIAAPTQATITLTDGSAKFTMRNGTFTGGAWAADFFTDVGGQDHMFRNQWYYRRGSQIMEHQLSSDNNTTEGATGNTGFIEWSESGYDFRLDLVLTDTGDGTAQLVQTMSAINQTGTTDSITLFNYTDYEFGGFLSPNFATRDADGIEVTNANLPDTVARFDDTTPAAHFQIASGSVILNQLDDFDVTELADTNNQAFDDTTAAYEFFNNTIPMLAVQAITTLQIESTTNPADLDGNGQLNFFDVARFLELYMDGDLQVDFDASGDLNFFDVAQFLDFYALG